MSKTVFINSPLGITKIVGDESGVSIISILSEGELSTKIPNELLSCAGIRKIFKKTLLSPVNTRE